MSETLDDAYIQDPHTFFERLRREAPACQVVMPGGLKVWLVTRYDEARAALADPALSKDSERAAPLHDRQAAQRGAARATFAEELSRHMLNVDPPDHTRLRTLVGKAFTARRVELLRPRIEEIAEDLLDDLAGEVDLVQAFALPLPLTVICELFGVPSGDRDQLRSWMNAIVTAADAEVVSKASVLIAEYLLDLIEAKRVQPADDLLSDLVLASDGGDRLDVNEMTAMAFLMLSAGHETATHLISNSVLSLLRHPDQLAALRANPTLLPGAVEEFLRYEGPGNTVTLRFTTAPVRLGEVEVPEGEFVLVAQASANRDPARFDDADQLDINRKPNRHLAFGHGIHHCLGAPLARLEGQIAIGRLLARFPGLALAVEPAELRWRNSTMFHGLQTLPVTLG